MVQKKSKPKPNQNQTKFKSTSLRTTRTTRTPSQSLLISISIFKLILISISIHLSFLISNYSLNPIYGQTLNEFYQTQSHQFIHLFLIPISFTFTLSFFNRFQKSKKLHLLSNLTSLYFLILSIFIQRLPLLYSFNNWFESDLKYFKLYPLLSALKGELPIRFLGILIGFLNLESALNDDRSNPFQNQPSFIKSTRIFILSFIFHLFLKLTQNPFHQFILSIFEPCEVFSITSISFFIFSIFILLIDFKTHQNTFNLNHSIFKLIFILLIYQSIPSSQSLCKDEPTDYTKTQTNLISRRLSKTGLISVGEFRDLQSNEVFRYLRSDHSILGGIWIGPALNSIQTQFHQNHFNQTQLQLHALQISESIYSTFIIQQAIRLVIRNQSDHQSPPEALIIGLGIGISAKSLMNHSIKTTVVEIDPIVYQYALTHFGFDPPNGGIFLEDIQLFLNRSESENLIDRFDYVIHDVFTGGMVPPQLFVKPFWISLKKVLKSDGVLVINFAGIPTSQAGLMILFTIFDVFENCRTFSEEENEETNENLEFQNLVIFCKMNESPKFRKVTRSDVFNSSHQFWILNRFLQHEITFRISRILNSDSFQSKKKEFILEGRMDWIKLRGNLMESALEHWKVMRTVLDRKTWENYY